MINKEERGVTEAFENCTNSWKKGKEKRMNVKKKGHKNIGFAPHFSVALSI